VSPHLGERVRISSSVSQTAASCVLLGRNVELFCDYTDVQMYVKHAYES
jgi:hypothetical protein